ncbi:Hypothetical predicted protein [Mytilus galloprovincialis]|uniref:Uncharacterized protein n=1 Tax=Mytilus galloprovincialis TaxID=29158 RepID=A0A8B6C6G8_MYTGA|nr:Hypothetical predicted protein [Mytilus galloprovincialis]
MIRPIVPGKYGKLCKVDIPITEFLFGDNLDEKVDKLDKDDKSSDKDDKSSDKLSMESGGGFFLGKRKHKWSQDSHWGPAKEKKLATGQILGKKQKETIETKDNALNASIDDFQQRNLQSGEQVPVRNIWIREKSVEGKITL